MCVPQLCAAWFKLNSGFLDARFSCATIYNVALVDQNLPASLLERYPAIGAVTAATAPALVFLVEAVIPFLLWLTPSFGAWFTAFFHWMIAIVPPPNDIASFGVATLPRVLLAQYSLEDMVLGFRGATSLGGGGVFAAAVVALTVALQPRAMVLPSDVAVPICGFFSAVICLATAAQWTSRRPPEGSPSGARPARPFFSLRLIAVLYSLVLVPIGLFDVGNASPFSSLRKHGGSNVRFQRIIRARRHASRLPPGSDRLAGTHDSTT